MITPSRVSLGPIPLLRTCVALGMLGCLALPARAEPTDEELRALALKRAARTTRARLEKRSARWTVVHTTRAGARVEVEVVRSPFATRRLIRVQLPQRPPREVLRVIEREGAWYVSEVGGARGIYAPRSAPFLYPESYRTLDASLLKVVGDDTSALGSYQGVDDAKKGTWRYRRELPAAQVKHLQRLITSLEGLVKSRPTPQVKVRLTQAKQALKAGNLTLVDPATGLLVAHGPPEHRVRVLGFRWLDQPDLSAFVTQGEALVDRRAPLKEPVLLAHCGIWRAGEQRAEVDLRWVSLSSGEVRRPALSLPLALPGWASRDGKTLLVTAPRAGSVGLFRVSLPQGEAQRLGGRALSYGVCLQPTLSPDGKTVALLHLRDDTSTKSQPTLVDLAKPERVRLIGVPQDSGNTLSFFPKGDALLLTRRVAFLPGEPPYSSIVRLSLHGGVLTELRRGESPVFVQGGTRILYRDRHGRWHTCSLTGKDPRPVLDGLAGLESPAPGPKGQRVLMIEARKQGPRPVVVDLVKGTRTPLPLKAPHAEGLWGLPVW